MTSGSPCGSALPEPPGPQGHGGVPGRRQQGQPDARRTHLVGPAAQHEHGEPGQRPGHGGGPAPAEALPHPVPAAERDQHRPGTEGDDGADREPGLVHGAEVGGLEEGEQQPRSDKGGGRRPDGSRGGRPAADGEHPQQHHEPPGAAPEGQGERTEVTGQEEEGSRRPGGAPGGSGDDEVQQTAPGSGQVVRHVVLRACVKDERNRSSLRGQRTPAREHPGRVLRRRGAARARRREAEARSRA